MEEAAVDQFVASLLKERTRLRLSRTELSSLSYYPDGNGVSYAALRRIEKGECRPRPATIRVLERALREVSRERERGDGGSRQSADSEVRESTTQP